MGSVIRKKTMMECKEYMVLVKKLSLVLICILLTTSLFAIEITVGGATGINTTFMTGFPDYDEYEKLGLRYGFEAGVFGIFAFNDLFSLQPELGFFMYRSGPAVDDFNIKITTTTMAIEVALLPKFSFYNFSAFLGPALHIIPGPQTYKITKDGKELIRDEYGFYDRDRSIVLTGIFGIDYLLPFWHGGFLFDLRYRRQFTMIREDFEERANTFSFRVGYGFRVK